MVWFMVVAFSPVLPLNVFLEKHIFDDDQPLAWYRARACKQVMKERYPGCQVILIGICRPRRPDWVRERTGA